MNIKYQSVSQGPNLRGSLPNDTINRLGKVVDVISIQPGHRDTAVFRLGSIIVIIGKESSTTKVTGEEGEKIYIKSKKKTHHIDMPLLSQNPNLLLRQAGEAEHADLAGDMVP